MLTRSLVALGTVAVAASCSTTELTATHVKAPAEAGTCAFQLLTALPSTPYVEVGIVETQLGDYGSNLFSTLADFKKEISRDVCRIGGDLAVAHANDAGIFIRATVLKSTGGAPPSTLPTAAGCQFDNQCKGERLCIHGECSDPPRR